MTDIEKEQADEKKSDAPSPPPIPSHTNDDETKANEKRSNANQIIYGFWQNTRDRWAFFVTNPNSPNWIVATFTIILALYTIKLVSFTGKQVADSYQFATRTIGVAESTMIVDNRAWLGISSIVNSEDGIWQGTKITSTLTNFGKTPAHRVRYYLDVFWQRSAEYQRPDMSDQKYWKGEYVVAPTQAFSQEFIIGDTTSSDILSDINTGKLKLFYYLFVVYDDTFGGRDTTEFCNIYDPKRRAFGSYKTFNSMK